MESGDQYLVGAQLKELDYYAFPRTGSHLLYYSLTGLFDLVTKLPEEIRTNPEAASRKFELSEEAVYSLQLREPDAAVAPLLLNTMRHGLHGLPEPGDNAILMLIRNPLAATFSAWCTRRRLGFDLDTGAQLAKHLDRYEQFYDAAIQLVASQDTPALLIRYENLVSPFAFRDLDAIAKFVGLQPKLSPRFVAWVTRFDRFVARENRGFYRAGDNTAWRGNEDFADLLASAGPPRDFRRFGYEKEDTSLLSFAVQRT